MRRANLRSEILKEHSKAQSLAIAGRIGKNARRFAALMDLFLHDEYRVVQRAAGIVAIVAERYPALIRPHLAPMIARMGEPGLPVAVKRNVVRILQVTDIPEALHGPVMNTCFELLADPKETIAVRAFSMTVLANLARIYPDLKTELKAVIEAGLAHRPSAGFRARARKVLAGL